MAISTMRGMRWWLEDYSTSSSAIGRRAPGRTRTAGRTRVYARSPYDDQCRNLRQKADMNRLYLCCLALLMSASMTGVAQQAIVAPSRSINWPAAGVPGGIPNRTTICATLNPGATAADINAAIASCPSGQVVFLNAGMYDLTIGILFNNKSNVTLRGAGPNQTLLTFSSGDPCGGLGGNICFKNGDTNSSLDPRFPPNWTAGYSTGTTSITLSNATGLQVGSLLILDQLDDSDTDTGEIWSCQNLGGGGQQGGVAPGGPRR